MFRQPHWRRALKAFVANPFIVAIFLGFLLSFGGIGIAQVADDFLRILGSAAIPTALFAIGATLYGQPIGSAWIEIGVVFTIKLIVHPAAVFVFTTQVFDLPTDLVAVATLSAALPMANNLFVIATRYKVRPPVASAAILISTIAAIGTFNVWAAIVLP